MYIKRTLEKKIKQISKNFPVAALVGPRQSGKTTLIKKIFPRKKYLSLENLDTRKFAQEDPRGFLKTYSGGVILDEAQNVPHLFSYIQGIVDENKKAGEFILTGSQNFLLHEKITQSLAGRVGMLTLLPLSFAELKLAKIWPADYPEIILKGFYPSIHEKKINFHDWHMNYIRAYIERDARTLKQITDLSSFQNFILLCAGRVGQILNLSSLANDCGISHNTAKAWISLLEASFIIFLLKPHHKNFNKRIIKMPKIYFYDTGVLSSLLGIETIEQLETHPFKGGIFESFIVSEMFKYRFNKGLRPNCFFWRDKMGHEIDCLLEFGNKLIPVEIKSSRTITDDFFKELKYWNNLSGGKAKNSFVVYGGNEEQSRQNGQALGWKNIEKIFI